MGNGTRIGWEKEEEWKKLSSEELRRKKAQGLSEEKLALVNIILDERDRKERKEEIGNGLEMARENAISTRNLFWATLALVIVTAFPTIISLIKWIIRWIKPN